MADRATAEGSLPNLHKDEVTGEMVSKSELKKRQKKRDGDAKKVFLFFILFLAPPPPFSQTNRKPVFFISFIFSILFYSDTEENRPRRPLLPCQGGRLQRRRLRRRRLRLWRRSLRLTFVLIALSPPLIISCGLN